MSLAAWMMSGSIYLDTEIDDSSLKGLPQYTEFKIRYTNICMRCEREFSFKAYAYDDARFVRFCSNCRSRVKCGDYDLDFTETVGN